jgi:hypothetical protein
MPTFEVAYEAYCGIPLDASLKKGLRKRWDGIRKKRTEVPVEEAKLFFVQYLPDVIESQRLLLKDRHARLTKELSLIQQTLEELEYETI